jgi:hypothetical protein
MTLNLGDAICASYITKKLNFQKQNFTRIEKMKLILSLIGGLSARRGYVQSKEACDPTKPIDIIDEYPEHYQWSLSPVTKTEAREYCQSLGENWDISIMNNQGEHNLFKEVTLSSACLGMSKN